MEYLLLVIGYDSDISFASQSILSTFDHLNFVPLPVHKLSPGNIDLVVESLKRIKPNVSGVLYLRKELYLMLASRIEFSVPTRYVEWDDIYIQQLLLRVRLHIHSPLRGISADTFKSSDLRPLLKDADIFSPNAKIWDIPFNACFQQDSSEIAQEHYRNLQNGADIVFTCLPSVYQELKLKNAPVFLFQPSASGIVQEIRNLKLGIRLRAKQDRLAIIYLCLRYKYTTIDLIQVQMRELEELANVTKDVNLYARSIDGSAVSLSRWEFLILCDESALAQKSKNFSDISLLRKIGEGSVFDAIMSIGIGKTAKSAYDGSMTSYAVSVKIRNTNAVITIDNKTTLPPLVYKEVSSSTTDNTDDTIFEIAEKCHIGYDSLHKLYLAKVEKDSSLFTSAEIADILGLSVRSANRLLQPLLDNNCATIVNSVSLNKKGRPTRVIKIHF